MESKRIKVNQFDMDELAKSGIKTYGQIKLLCVLVDKIIDSMKTEHNDCVWIAHEELLESCDKVISMSQLRRLLKEFEDLEIIKRKTTSKPFDVGKITYFSIGTLYGHYLYSKDD
jgi:hypothetical protein